MNLAELKEAYIRLSEEDRILFASYVEADRLVCSDEFKSRITRRHEKMDQGIKWSHQAVVELSDRLADEGL